MPPALDARVRRPIPQPLLHAPAATFCEFLL